MSEYASLYVVQRDPGPCLREIPGIADMLRLQQIGAPSLGRQVWYFHGERVMSHSKQKFNLGKSGTVTCYVSKDAKRLLIEFNVEKEGLTKTGLNGFIDALKTVREKMVR